MSTIVAKYSKQTHVYPNTLHMYRNQLRQSRKQNDEAIQYYIIRETRLRYRKNKTLSTEYSIDTALNEAFGMLKKVSRVHLGSYSDQRTLIGITYGFMGPNVGIRRDIHNKQKFYGKQPESSTFVFPVCWWNQPGETDAVGHPRALKAFDKDPEPFLQDLLLFTNTLHQHEKAAYFRWKDQSWMPRGKVVLHKQGEWQEEDILKKRREIKSVQSENIEIEWNAYKSPLPEYMRIYKDSIQKTDASLHKPIPVILFDKQIA